MNGKEFLKALDHIVEEKNISREVVLEAMQLGKIIITANTKGCCDLIKDFENGILYKFNNINDLTNKFRLVKNNLTLQQKLSKNA